MFGTISGKRGTVPPEVKRTVCRDDAKKEAKMRETIQGCGLVVIDLENSTADDIHFVLSSLNIDWKSDPPKTTGVLENEVICILISSVMVWAGTKTQDAGGMLKASDYVSRVPRPGSMYQQWKDLEDLFLKCLNAEDTKVKAYVVAGGVLYGKGESTFARLFEDSWRGQKGLAILGSGANRIPTVHVQDLAKVVRHIGFAGEGVSPATNPYFLAVDLTPAPTQVEILQAIVNELCEQYPMATLPLPDEPQDELQEALSLNLMMEPTITSVNPDFSADAWCATGMIANMQKVAGEFCEAKQLRAMKVLVSGPPACGKTTLAAAIAEHFNIPPLELSSRTLGEMATELGAKECRYRGYVLDAGVAGYKEMEELYTTLEPVQEDDEPQDPQENEGEEKEQKMCRVICKDICPDFVIVLQAERELCEYRWKARGSPQDQFEKHMKKYEDNNLQEDLNNITDFFQNEAQVGVLNLPVIRKEEDDIFESTRIYMEKAGRPFNYLPTEAEVAASLLERKTQQEEADHDEAIAEARRQEDDGKERSREAARHVERLRIISEYEAAHRKLQELPLREYLMQYMVPNLSEGLIEVCKVLPDDPIDYLAVYLENSAAQVGSQRSGPKNN